jgi:hypothetical protein
MRKIRIFLLKERVTASQLHLRNGERHGGETWVSPMESVAKRARVKIYDERALAQQRQRATL